MHIPFLCLEGSSVASSSWAMLPMSAAILERGKMWTGGVECWEDEEEEEDLRGCVS